MDCKVNNCNNLACKKGLCIKHYKRWYSRGDSALAESFHCSACQKEISYKRYNDSGICQSCYGQKYYSSNIEKWQLSSSEKIQKRIYGKAYYQVNREKELAYDKAYWANPINKERRNKRHQEYRKNREATDPSYKLRRVLRNRLNNALKNNQKVGSAVSDLGCTIDELKRYLESLWEPGMTWENHTHGGWHIDHIKPLCSFDLTNLDQLKAACHYTNLSPVWEKNNLSKATKDKTCRQK